MLLWVSQELEIVVDLDRRRLLDGRLLLRLASHQWIVDQLDFGPPCPLLGDVLVLQPRLPPLVVAENIVMDLDESFLRQVGLLVTGKEVISLTMEPYRIIRIELGVTRIELIELFHNLLLSQIRE